MKKRQFLSQSVTMLLGAAGMSATSVQAAAVLKPTGQVILTLTGSVDRTNRGKLDSMLDQLMHKHGIGFERAFNFTLADLQKLPAVSITPTLEYDARPHKLTGPRLLDVLNVAGIRNPAPTSLILHGIDGYSPEISFELAKKYDFILATHIDDSLLAIGGFGPLFAVYDADRIAELAAKPLAQRFTVCPWGLYCIEVV